MAKKADKNKTTIYGLVKLYEDKISELQNLLDSTEQNEFLVKCQKEELRALNRKISHLENLLESKQATIGLNNPDYTIGKKRNHLTIIGYGKDSGDRVRLLCRCDCGNIRLIHQWHWANDKVKSCGCMHDELCRNNSRKEIV